MQIFTPVDEVQGARLTRLLAMSYEQRRAAWVDHVALWPGAARPAPVGLQRWE
ncbi:hypothetical protein [Nocardia salmonicida]|uniref:hypothetical protein n=1 Tax=Nocardia salmonicida TaxID=53431 RepID=UPI00342DEEB8